MNLNTGTPGVPAAAATIAGALVLWLQDVVRYGLARLSLPDELTTSTEAIALLLVAGAVGWLAQRWTWASSTVEQIGEYTDPDWRGPQGIAHDPDDE